MHMKQIPFSLYLYRNILMDFFTVENNGFLLLIKY